MPEMSGEETLLRLREIGSAVPVLFASGNDTQRLAAAYGVGSLQKQYGFLQLKELVGKYLAD
jgi:hypothetical protein